MLFSQKETSNEMLKLYNKEEGYLNSLNANSLGRHYGQICFVAPTGIGKSYSAISFGEEKVKKALSQGISVPQVIYVSKKKNNLVKKTDFTPEIQKYVTEIKSKDDASINFIKNTHSVLSSGKYDNPNLTYYLKDFEQYVDFGNENDRDKPISNNLENLNLKNQATYQKFEDILSEFDFAIFRKHFEIGQYSKELKNYTKEQFDKKYKKLTHILRDLMYKILIYEQKKNPEHIYFKISKKYLANISYAHIKLGLNSSKLIYLRSKLNLTKAYKFIYNNFQVIRDLYSQIAINFSPISILTTQKLFLPSNLILQTKSSLYEVIETEADPVIIIDEFTETKETLNEILAEQGTATIDLINASAPLANLSFNNIADGVIGEDESETKAVVKKATKRLQEVFKNYKLINKIFAGPSMLVEAKRKQTMFITTGYNIPLSTNKIKIEINGKKRYVSRFWIDTRDSKNKHRLILRDICYYNFKTNNLVDNKQSDKEIFKQAEQLNRIYKKGNYSIYPFDQMVWELNKATRSTIIKLSQAAFGSKFRKLEKILPPNLQYDDNLELFKLLIDLNLNDNIYNFYANTANSNLNKNYAYRTTSKSLDNQGFSVFSLYVYTTQAISIQWGYIPNSAERLWLDITSKYKVFSIDALGDLRDNPKNFSMEYLNTNLFNHFKIAKSKELYKAIKAKMSYEKSLLSPKVIKNNPIMPTMLETMNKVFMLNEKENFINSLSKINENKRTKLLMALAQLFYGKETVNIFTEKLINIDFDLNKNGEFEELRWIKRINVLLRCLDQMAQHPEYRSAIFFINNSLTEVQIQSIKTIASIYSEINNYEFLNEWIESWTAKDFKLQSFELLSSDNIPHYQKVLNNELSQGKNKIIFTTYATMAKGQNVNYHIPNDCTIEQKLVSLAVDKEKDTTKDWDMVYLEQPTSIINTYNPKEPKSLFLLLLDLKSLHDVGGITYKEINKILINSLLKQDVQFQQYNRQAIQLVLTTIVAQALGRLNRTKNRLNQIVFLDQELCSKKVGTNDINLLQFNSFKDFRRAVPFLTTLEDAIFKETMTENDFNQDISNLYKKDVDYDKIQRLNAAERTSDEVKRLIQNEDYDYLVKEKWVANSFKRAFILANPMLSKNEFLKYQNFMSMMSNSSLTNNRGVDILIADYLKHAYLKVGNNNNTVHENNQYWILKNKIDNLITDLIFGEPFTKDQYSNNKQLLHVNLTNNGMIASLLKIPGFLNWLNINRPTIKSLLSRDEINTLIQGRADIENIPQNKLKIIQDTRKSFLIPILNKKINWDNYLSSQSYLPTHAYYLDLQGFLGEQAAVYINENIKKLSGKGYNLQLINYTDDIFLDGILKEFPEVADFATSNSTTSNITLVDIKTWKYAFETRKLYLNKGRKKKIAKIASIDGVEHVNYIFMNVLRSADMQPKIPLPYTVSDLPNVTFYEIPFLYDLGNNTFLGNSGYEYQRLKLMNLLNENNLKGQNI